MMQTEQTRRFGPHLVAFVAKTVFFLPFTRSKYGLFPSHFLPDLGLNIYHLTPFLKIFWPVFTLTVR